MLNIIHFSYVPNTASTNRLLAYLFNIPNSVKVRLFFIMPDSKNSIWEEAPKNIDVVYCWLKFKAPCKILKFITYKLSLRYIRKSLRNNDVVYCYNIPFYMSKLKKEGVKYFGERTEHPEVTSSQSRLVPHKLDNHLKLCRQLDGIFVISTALRDYYIDNGVDPSKIHIINMTVDVQRFTGLHKDDKVEKYIAYCGSALNNKDGVDKLIRSFAIVNKTHPDVKLFIIGQAPSSDANENVQLAKSLGIIDNIVFTGLVQASEMPQLLKNAKILALNRPDSLQAKCGFATKLGEYLLTENPVVVTKVGDVPLFLKDGESALLSSASDDCEFAQKLCWVLEHPNEAEIIGKNGAEVAKSNFNAKIETSKILKLFQL